MGEETADITLKRHQLKDFAMRVRMATTGECKCDICGIRPGVEYHEVVSRGRTQGAPDDIRLLSYEPAICALLCQQCHMNIAPTTAGRKIIFEKLIWLFGVKKVLECLFAIPEKYRRGIELPNIGSEDE